MTVLNIVPECYVDTKVAEIVGRGYYNHQHGCGDVANQIKNKLKDRSALGIIDEDKHKGPVTKYFLEFDLLAEENGLILKKHPEKLHYLIMICPEIEKWLLATANSINLNPINFGLRENLENLKKLTKTQNINNNIGFYRFIKEMIKNEAPGIMTLQKWINRFTEGDPALTTT